MLKSLTIVAALLSAATSANADYVRVYRTPAETTRVQCHKVYGCTITTAPAVSNDARVIHVPEDMQRNTSDTWGAGCPSCVDLQRAPSPSSFEAGR